MLLEKKPFHQYDNEGSYNVSLTVTSSSISVEVEIEDLVTNVNTQFPCFSGSVQDPNALFAWTLSSGSAIPSDLARSSTIPAENTWNKYNVNSGVTYTYNGTPSAPPAYQGTTIRELFDSPKAAGLFTMSDLKPERKNNNPNVIIPDQAATLIFNTNPNTFVFDSNNEFSDNHSGIGIPTNILEDIFTSTALSSGKVGYSIKQYFGICGTSKGDAVIYRRYTQPSILEIKKTHNL